MTVTYHSNSKMDPQKSHLNQSFSSESLFPPLPVPFPSSKLPGKATLQHSFFILNQSRNRRDSEIVAQLLAPARPTVCIQHVSETEMELDALDRMVQPRIKRRSSISDLPPLQPRVMQPEQKYHWVHITVDEDLAEKTKKKTQPVRGKRYINLPKLPFGSHLSYNQEGNLREKIVSKRWKAWKREEKVNLSVDCS